ncbi:MAG: hypothetical protein BM555_05980 [Crocinitomix sp. MedPE-SWsnd]|nr:MAG: hypothetical protein BM555_05980 [Crocinitomix sp. MedPE-SWsnd]
MAQRTFIFLACSIVFISCRKDPIEYNPDEYDYRSKFVGAWEFRSEKFTWSWDYVPDGNGGWTGQGSETTVIFWKNNGSISKGSGKTELILSFGQGMKSFPLSINTGGHITIFDSFDYLGTGFNPNTSSSIDSLSFHNYVDEESEYANGSYYNIRSIIGNKL